MKRIKYKAWNNQQKRWATHDEHLREIAVTATVREVSKMTVGEDEWELLMFTGLEDEEGTEIYEGDIIQDNEGFVYEVKFEDGRFCVSCDDVYSMNGTNLIENNTYSKVIGNIYENAELLK